MNVILAEAIDFLQRALLVVPIQGDLIVLDMPCPGPVPVTSLNYSGADMVLLVTVWCIFMSYHA